MTQQLKRWESPRKPGRNQKGRGGSARQRQLKKQHKRFLKQLKAQAHINAQVTGAEQGKNANSHPTPDGLPPFTPMPTPIAFKSKPSANKPVKTNKPQKREETSNLFPFFNASRPFERAIA